MVLSMHDNHKDAFEATMTADGAAFRWVVLRSNDPLSNHLLYYP